MPAFPEWPDEDIVPISAISHHLYCARQNALIHMSGIFRDNELTTSGNIGHELVDEERSFVDHGVRKETWLRVFSDRLGITGIADFVEFPSGAPPFPIDYKNGRIKAWKNQEAQLCAVALCLEEMLGCEVPQGAIYHIQSKKRHEVRFGPSLRTATELVISEIREILQRQLVPAAIYSSKCDRCSLRRDCWPEFSSRPHLNVFEAIDV